MSKVKDPLADRLEQSYSGVVYDVIRAMGYPNQSLPTDINPLNVEWKLAGKVWTMAGHIVPSLDGHETLLSWTAFLSKAPTGSVVLCQPNDDTVSHMGELSSEALQFRGVRGYIVDGGIRDSAYIKKIGFKVFGRYTTPKDVVGRWRADAFGEPIQIGDVTIRTGDYVMADQDGVVVVPGDIVEEVVEKVEEAMRTENKVRTAILEGMDPQEAYLKYGKF